MKFLTKLAALFLLTTSVFAQQLIYNPLTQVLDANGDPYSGAKLYVFDAGTTTNRTTYSDKALTSANANPLVADSAGRFGPLYIAASSTDYKLRVDTSADVVIYTQDNIPISSIDQATLGLTLYPRTTEETSNGITPTNYFRKPGGCRRYDAKIDGTTDDTQAFQDSLDSGHPAHCLASGTANIEGTIIMNGVKELTLSAEITLERQSGSATTPMLQMYGNQNQLHANGATFRQDLYAHPHGVILIGPSLAETEGGTTDVQSNNNVIDGHIKIVGARNASAQDGIGIFIHSIGRKKYTVRNTTYSTYIESADIVNATWGMEFSTDANRGVFGSIFIHQWTTAAILWNASYGNHFFGLQLESPLDVSPTRRYALHFLSQNSGIESDTDVTYGITEAFANVINLFAELPNSDNKVVSLFTFDAITTEGGHNIMRGPLDSILAGFGVDGLMTEAKIGTNIIDGTELFIDYNRITKLQALELRNLDDDSGSYRLEGNSAHMFGRKANLAESTTVNLLSVDNIGTTSAGVKITLDYECKADGEKTTTGGETTFLANLRDTATYDSLKIKDFSATLPTAEAAIVVPGITTAAGTTSNTMKATIDLTTQNPDGGNSIFCAWDSKIMHTNLDGTNLDWDADLSYL